jgi:adhesin/invasin
MRTEPHDVPGRIGVRTRLARCAAVSVVTIAGALVASSAPAFASLSDGVTVSSNLAGATATMYTVCFHANTALNPGDSVTFAAPAGTTFQVAPGDYGFGSSSAPGTIVTTAPVLSGSTVTLVIPTGAFVGSGGGFCMFTNSSVTNPASGPAYNINVSTSLNTTPQAIGPYVIVGTADVTTSTIVASPTALTGNGSTTSTITVQGKDSAGTNVTTGGATVVVNTNLGTIGSVTDHNNGTYTATLTSSASAGTATVGATLGGAALTHTATVTFAGAAALATTTIVAVPTALTGNGSTTSTITVQAKDAAGNNLSTGGATIIVTTNLGTIGSVTDHSNGTYTATLTSSASAGTATVGATLGGTAIAQTATVTFAGPISLLTSTITPSLASIAGDGVTTSTITVQAKDAASNNLSTGGATIVVNSSAGVIGAVTDHANGTYTATLTSSVGAATATVGATIGGTAITNTTTVSFTVAATGGGTPATTTPAAPVRVAGTDRFGTAIATSVMEFPTANSAGAVVLARSDDFADALVGTTLAAAKNAPLLFANGAALTAATTAEIQRVLPVGGTVYLLGGTTAIPAAVATNLTTLGYLPVRYAGTDRYGTALAVADALNDPTTVVLATGLNFPDALAAGPGAAHAHGVVLLTDGTALTPAVQAYLTAHPGTVYAAGGPAAAADKAATPLVGADRYATAATLASALFTGPVNVGVASGTVFPDALTGGSFQAHAGGPIVLSDPAALPASTDSYLTTSDKTIVTTNLFGGTTALSAAVATAISTALGL